MPRKHIGKLCSLIALSGLAWCAPSVWAATGKLEADADEHKAAIATASMAIKKPKGAASKASSKPSPKAAKPAPLDLPKWQALLKSPQVPDRVLALNKLSQMGAKAAAAVPAIVTALEDNRSFATTANLSYAHSPLVTDAAIAALQSIGTGARQCAPLLVSILDDKNELFRRDQVLQALIATGAEDSACNTIIGVLNQEGKFTKTRLLAIKMLGRLEPPPQEALETLRQIAGDKTDSQARLEALHALSAVAASGTRGESQSKPTEEVEQLLSRLDPGNEKDGQIEALKALGKLAGESAPAVPRLIELCKGDDDDLQAAAIDTLGSIGAKAQAATAVLMIKLFQQKDEGKRDLIVRTLGLIDPKGHACLPLLRAAVEDPFKAPTARQVLDELDTPESRALSETTRKRWCMK